MFERKKDEVAPQELDKENPEREATPERHPASRLLALETRAMLYQEWGIFEMRYREAINLPEDATKTDVKRALSRVKRAAMDVRDALKKLGQFTL